MILVITLGLKNDVAGSVYAGSSAIFAYRFVSTTCITYGGKLQPSADAGILFQRNTESALAFYKPKRYTELLYC